MLGSAWQARALEWAAMARAERRLGTVRTRAGAGGAVRWYIDFGRRWGPRFLYGFRGVRFETREMAVGILSWVEFEVSKGRALPDVLSEVAPEAAGEAGVREWVARCAGPASQPPACRDRSRAGARWRGSGITASQASL